MSRPIVLLAGPLHGDAAARLARATDVVEIDAAALDHLRRGTDAPHDPPWERATGLVVRAGTRVDETLLARMPSLRAIARPGAGTDDIDLAACAARHVTVLFAPGANADAVAEYVFALLLAHLRPVPRLAAPLDEAGWAAARREAAPRELRERRLGVVGLGRIGSRVARIAHGFGMHVSWNDLEPQPSTAVAGATRLGERRPLEEIFAGCDVVTLHVDGRATNDGLVDAGHLGRLCDDAILVNTSRGRVVDVDALDAFLAAHPDAAALLDVHPVEPVPADSPLFGRPNAWLLPHAAARTNTALGAMSDVVDDLVAVLDGRAPRDEVVARPG